MKLRWMILIIALALVFLYTATDVRAESITLPNGTELNIDNLTETEISQAIKTARKSMEGKEAAKSVLGIVKGVDPTELEAWSKLISGTIKTVCEDLSITVNDFVKTPVGIGVAALIAYRVAGEELLSEALDIVVMIPLWFIATGVNLFLAWYFFSAKTIWDVSYNDKGKKLKQNVQRVKRYPWKQDHGSNEMPNEIVFAWVLGIVELLLTALTLLLVLG